METESRYCEAVRLYNEARSPANLERVLEQLDAVLDEPDLAGPSKLTGRLIRASCLTRLNRDAEKSLRSLLHDTEIDPWALARNMPIQVRLELAGALARKGQGREALEHYERAARWLGESGDRESETNVHRTVASMLIGMGEPAPAMVHLESAWALAKDMSPSPLQVDVLHGLGHALHVLERNEEAVLRFEQAYDLATKFNDSERAGSLLHNLAELTFREQDFRRALHYVSLARAQARRGGDDERALRLTAFLGSVQVESGRPAEALQSFEEVESLTSTSDDVPASLVEAVETGFARAHLDLKHYDEARECLRRARLLGRDDYLLDRIEEQLEREGGSPLAVDCAHRALMMALTGTSNDLSHSNPSPVIEAGDLSPLLSDELTREDRNVLAELRKELSSEMLQVRYTPSANEGLPSVMQRGFKFHYVDDVDDFEHKWTLYAVEQRRLGEAHNALETWKRLRSQHRFVEGPLAGEPAELVEYLLSLARLSELLADLDDLEGLTEVALHAADFLEATTDDPMIAVMFWGVRARLFASAHRICPSWARDLLSVELIRSLHRGVEANCLLAKERLPGSLETRLLSWLEVPAAVPCEQAYRAVISIAGDLLDLVPLDKLPQVVVAMAACGDHRGALALIDRSIEHLQATQPDLRIAVDADLGSARAASRFVTLCTNSAACKRTYGPFAGFIHQEVQELWPSLFPLYADPAVPAVVGVRLPPLAGLHGNLVIYDNRYDRKLWAYITEHELVHASRRAGQQYMTSDGCWRLCRRDVPTASALTYLKFLGEEDLGAIEACRESLEALVVCGRDHSEDDPDGAAVQVEHMLRYFDDLGDQESPASYPCAAILVGMAYGFLGRNATDEVSAYLRHLKVMDHSEALRFGRRKDVLVL